MAIGLVFWVLMLFWLVFCIWRNYPFTLGPAWGADMLVFILFLLLGWHAFGPPIHG